MTYDAHETGVVEDRLGGGVEVTGVWFNLAHSWPLRAVLEMLAWQPELFGPARENHVLRSSSVVDSVCYGKGRIVYSTFDALAPCEDVLRAPPGAGRHSFVPVTQHCIGLQRGWSRQGRTAA